MSESITTVVTLFGDARIVEFRSYTEDMTRLTSHGLVVVGRFPTGTKLHASSLTLWKREQVRNGNTYVSRGPTAAIVDGVEYIADSTLYIHNSNRGRIVAWNDDLADSGWRGY